MDKVAEEEVGGGAPIGEHGAVTKIRRQQIHSGVGSKWRCSGEEEELIEGASEERVWEKQRKRK